VRLCADEEPDGIEDDYKPTNRVSRGSEATYIDSDDSSNTCFRWKLHEKLILDGEEKLPTMIVMEVKTWQGESTEYGSIELHYAELLTDSHTFYMGGKLAYLTQIDDFSPRHNVSL
jgi:hypothetical protein